MAKNKVAFNPLAATITALAIVALFVLLFRGSPQQQVTSEGEQTPSEQREEETPIGALEFRDVNYTETSDPSQATMVIVTGEGACDARPIDLTARSNGETVWEGTISADEPNCADKNTTSKSIQEIDEEWDEMEARDRYGNLFALFMLLGAQ